MLTPRYPSDFILQVGCDEAGRGCLAGPVVASAVLLPEDFSHPSIRDSKAMNPELRCEMAALIKEKAMAYGIAEVSHEEIDQINILKASILAMHRALDQISLKMEVLLIDGNKFYPYRDLPHHCIVKGDDTYLSIAAASILAKTHRDELMKKFHTEFPQYQFHKNKGYASSAHVEAIKIHGYSPIHRKTFKLKKLAGQLFLFD